LFIGFFGKYSLVHIPGFLNQPGWFSANEARAALNSSGWRVNQLGEGRVKRLVGEFLPQRPGDSEVDDLRQRGPSSSVTSTIEGLMSR
jgi:hypothetical protein